MRHLAVLAVTLTLTLVGCGETTDEAATPEQPAVTATESEPEPERPGSAAVYAEIEASTDCADLQETFSRNMDRYEMRDALERTDDGNPGTWEFAYANAALARMEDLDC